MYRKCILCNVDADSLVLNGLKTKQCPDCKLIWLEKFSQEDYKEFDIDIRQKKLKAREQNCVARFRLLKRFFDFNNLCDVGCGEGIFLKLLRDEGYVNLFGIEPNRRNVNFAKSMGLDIKEGSVQNFSQIATKETRGVTLFHVLEHLEDPLLDLKVIYKTLPQGGRIALETPDVESYYVKKLNYNHSLICPQHNFYFNSRNLKNLLEKSGFKIVASGRRDFNMHNKSLKEILFRLGFIFYPEKSVVKISSSGLGNLPKASGFLRSAAVTAAKKILVPIIIALGRLDFIWIVAEK